MSPQEERNLLESINFNQFGSEISELSQFLLQSRQSHVISISKLEYSQLQHSFQKTPTDHARLSKLYKLESDSDVLLSEAQLCFLQTDYDKTLCITTKLLDSDPYHRECLPLHIASLYELKEKNRLFLLAHQLVDLYPTEALPWLAVGSFYLLSGKNHEARRYFSKASTIDPLLGSAWIGFGHSFALEDESDQAISAYSAAARILKGCAPLI